MISMDATGCTRTGARKALGKRSPRDQVLDEKLIWRQQQSTVMAMAISYNWLFQWDYIFHKWDDLVFITGILGHRPQL